MTDTLGPLRPDFLHGELPFSGAGTPSLQLRDYWRWSASCLLDNTSRGVLAEFLVATALRAFVRERPRSEWDAYDLQAEVGDRDVAVEVKSSARVQSWAQRKLSSPQFSIAPTRKWNPATGRYGDEGRADVYVFCLFTPTRVDSHAAALNVDHWQFRVAAEPELPSQRAVGWNRLSGFQMCGYQDLRGEFEAAVARLEKTGGLGSSPTESDRSNG